MLYAGPTATFDTTRPRLTLHIGTTLDDDEELFIAICADNRPFLKNAKFASGVSRRYLKSDSESDLRSTVYLTVETIELLHHLLGEILETRKEQ